MISVSIADPQGEEIGQRFDRPDVRLRSQSVGVRHDAADIQRQQIERF